MCNGITCIVLSVSLGGKKHGNGIQRCTQCNDRNFATKEIAAVCPCCNYRLRSHPRQSDLKRTVKVNDTIPFRNEIFFCIPKEFRDDKTVVRKIIRAEMKVFGRKKSSSVSAFERFERLMRQYDKALEIMIRDDSGLTQNQIDYIEELKADEREYKRKYARVRYYIRNWGPDGEEYRKKASEYQMKKIREMTPERQEALKKNAREKYANDPEYRERVLANNRKWQHAHPEYKRKRKEYYTKNREIIKKKAREAYRDSKKE